MTGPAGGLFRFRGFVQRGFEIQRRFRILFEELVVTGGAIVVRALRMRSVIKGDIAVLGGKGELFGRLLFLSNES